MPTVRLIDTQGEIRDVPAESAASAIESGWRVPSTEEQLARTTAQAREENYGGVGGAVKAGLAGAARGATLGLSDVALRAAGGEDAAIALEGYRDVNPGLSIGGEIIGGVAPALISGGASLPAGAANLAGRGAARAAGGGLRGALAGGVVEGGLQGVGAGVSQLALSTDDLTLERAASVLSSNALFGAGVGGAAGGVLHPVERGLAKAGALLDERMAQRAAREAVPGDLATLDAKGLRGARGAELDRLAADQGAQRTTARSAAVDDVLTYRQTVKDANPWLAISEGEDAARLGKATSSLRRTLDDAKGLRESPGPLLKPLRIEEQALEGAIARTDEIAAKFDAVNVKLADDLAEELATLPGRATSVDLTGRAARRYASFADVRVTKGGSVSVPREAAQEFLDALRTGEVQGAGRQALDQLSSLLDQNRALQAKIKEAVSPLTPRADMASPRLTEIDDALDVLRAPKPEPGLLEKAASGGVFGAATGVASAIPGIGQIPGVAHLIGAKAADVITGLVFGRMGKATGEIAARTTAAVKAFAGAVGAAAPYAPVVATKVLQGVRYAASRDDDDEKPDLPKLFKRRADEVKSLTEYDETGTPRVRPEVRAAVAEKLRPIAAINPIAADRLETTAVRRIEHVSSLIPRQPDFGAIAMPNWQPSDMAIRSWARTIAASEDPAGVEERTAIGAITPEDVAAYWAVYPERAEDFKHQILAEIQDGETKIPYTRKLALSMLIGEPVDPTLHPRVIAALQSSFPVEPGSAGGAQSPRAQPQMGSLKKLSENGMTPAQERQR